MQQRSKYNRGNDFPQFNEFPFFQGRRLIESLIERAVTEEYLPVCAFGTVSELRVISLSGIFAGISNSETGLLQVFRCESGHAIAAQLWVLLPCGAIINLVPTGSRQ